MLLRRYGTPPYCEVLYVRSYIVLQLRFELSAHCIKLEIKKSTLYYRLEIDAFLMMKKSLQFFTRR